KVVLFRNGGGQAAALEDCCCHRAAPLSKGEVAGDYLACGYHGLKYDINGKCVEVPGQTMIPRGAKVRSYPIRPRRCISTSAVPSRDPALPPATAARAYRSGQAIWSRPRPRRRVTTCSALPATLRSATATCPSSFTRARKPPFWKTRTCSKQCRPTA